jgi:acylaminoacyl-peptidase
MYRDGDIPRGLFGKRYLQMVLGTDAADMRKRSPAANADRIKASLMLVAGGRDQRVPISQAEALRSALDARKHPYEWMLKDKEGHGFFRTENSIELYTKMVEFLDASIGRGKGVAAAPPTPTSAAPSGAGSGR